MLKLYNVSVVVIKFLSLVRELVGRALGCVRWLTHCCVDTNKHLTFYNWLQIYYLTDAHSQQRRVRLELASPYQANFRMHHTII